MALTSDRTLEMAQSVQAACDDLKKIFETLETVLQSNIALGIDWTGDPLPGYIAEDADNNIAGTLYTRHQIADVLGSLHEIQQLMNNEAITQGDHLGNINAVATVNP